MKSQIRILWRKEKYIYIRFVNLKIKQQVKVVNYNINAANCNVLSMMQYVHCLRNLRNQSTAICRQIIRVNIEVE